MSESFFDGERYGTRNTNYRISQPKELNFYSSTKLLCALLVESKLHSHHSVFTTCLMHIRRKKSMDSMYNKITACIGQQRRTIYCAVVALTLITFPILLWGSWARHNSLRTTSLTKPLFESIMTARDTCQVTKVFPFRVGCPKQCERQSYPDEPMYRMSMAWYLGMPDMEEGTAYDRGINYQCPVEFVNNFRSSAKELGTIQSIRDVQVKFQPRMHISLNYLCCLRKNETDWVREVMSKWRLDNYPYSFSVKFDRFQCWHERRNSVTTIIIADEQSQHTLLKMSNDIEEKLLQKGIPTEVHRTDQYVSQLQYLTRMLCVISFVLFAFPVQDALSCDVTWRIPRD